MKPCYEIWGNFSSDRYCRPTTCMKCTFNENDALIILKEFQEKFPHYTFELRCYNPLGKVIYIHSPQINKPASHLIGRIEL